MWVGFMTRRATDAIAILEIPLSRLEVDPRRPRRVLSREALGRLAEDLGRFGVSQPLVVRGMEAGGDDDPGDGQRYWIVNGERRYRAAEMAGLKTVPCVVRKLLEAEALEFQLAENVEREDLSTADRVRTMRELHDVMRRSHGTASWVEVARRVGLSTRSFRYLRKLCDLPKPLWERLEVGQLSAEQAVLLGTLHDRPAMQLSLANECLKSGGARSGLSCKELRRRIRLARMADEAESILADEGLVLLNAVRFGKAELWPPEVAGVLEEIREGIGRMMGRHG